MKHHWGVAGAVSGAMAVMLGAFAAHSLKSHLEPADLQTFEVGARYQMYHALALVALGLVAGQRNHRALSLAGWLFCVGTILFSGSLYLLAVTGQHWLGAITPFGGVAFITGWIALAWGCRGRVVESSSGGA